jgi:carbamoyl-phosphate synthase large subunit
MKLKTYCFDIDGTICSTNCEYKDAEPFINVINYINKLYESGNKIIMFTSRGTKSGINWYDFTKNQIDTWGLQYHKLIMGKPQADIFIDDRAINIDNWCKKYNIIK